MIHYSSNGAATTLIQKVGRELYQQCLRSPNIACTTRPTTVACRVRKEYAQGVAYQRDPLHNLSHGATAIQVARFYYLLETGQLVTPELSRERKAILGNPGIHHNS